MGAKIEVRAADGVLSAKAKGFLGQYEFGKFLSACKAAGLRFDRAKKVWEGPPEKEPALVSELEKSGFEVFQGQLFPPARRQAQSPEEEKALQILKAVAAMDGDYARVQNGVGFGKFDCEIGHDLAEKSDRGLSDRQWAVVLKLGKKYAGQIVREAKRAWAEGACETPPALA